MRGAISGDFSWLARNIRRYDFSEDLLGANTPRSFQPEEPRTGPMCFGDFFAMAEWTAPIEWSVLNVSALWASGPSGRWFAGLRPAGAATKQPRN